MICGTGWWTGRPGSRCPRFPEPEGTDRHILTGDIVDPDDGPADTVGRSHTLGNADVNSIDHLRRAFAVGYPDDYAAIAQHSENHIVQPMMVGTAATYRAADGLRSQRRAKTFETQRINLN